MGVAPRRLMGWEPAEVTTCEYDSAGRMLRSVTVREPEFDADSLASLLMNRAASLRARGSHGHLLSEAMDPKADPSSWDAEYRYVAVGPRKDHAQAAIDAARKEMETKHPDEDLSALYWSVERVEL